MQTDRQTLGPSGGTFKTRQGMWFSGEKRTQRGSGNLRAEPHGLAGLVVTMGNTLNPQLSQEGQGFQVHGTVHVRVT